MAERINGLVVRALLMSSGVWTSAAVAQQAEVVLRVEPTMVNVGDSVRLTWSAPGIDRVFITRLGVVNGAGDRMLSPAASTTYVLIAEHGGSVSLHEVTVRVDGLRSGSDWPSVDLFRYPYSTYAESESFEQLVDRLYRVLQDSAGHSVNAIMARSGGIQLVTDRKLRTDLTSPGDRGVARRRTAYLIKLDPGDSSRRSYTISTLIEYQRRVERRWRREGSDDLHIQEARRLANLLAQGPRSP